jgi:hypothetical protein
MNTDSEKRSPILLSPILLFASRLGCSLPFFQPLSISLGLFRISCFGSRISPLQICDYLWFLKPGGKRLYPIWVESLPTIRVTWSIPHEKPAQLRAGINESGITE